MKCFFLFLFGLFFGFFDVSFFFFMFFFSLLVLFFSMNTFLFSGLFFCDGVSFFLLFLTVVIFFFCFFSSLLDSWFFNFSFGFIFCLYSIFFLLLVSFTSLSVFIFYVCFESIFMFMFFFVLTWGYSPERVQASFYMVFYTIVVSFPFLVYLIFFEESLLSLKFSGFYFFSSYWWFFLFLVFLVKLPVYGVHLWLPKAHVEAPVSGSMLLAGVLLKLGGYGFFRFSSYLIFSLSKSGFMYSLGLLGGLVSCVLCLRQSDLKSFVAYSSVCHMGFGLAGLYSLSFFGFEGGLYMMIAHGFCSSCLFYILYVFYKRYHTRSLFLLKGVLFLVPSMAFFWFLFSALNMGVPPSFSFFSEIFIIGGLLFLNLKIFLFCGMFLFLAGVYCIYMYVVSYHGQGLLEGMSFKVSVREYLNMYGHLFPLIFVPLNCSFFFF